MGEDRSFDRRSRQPTGWFAAGREFAQAITLLSDGAFKLYVCICLRAGRHTGCLRATHEELARALTRSEAAIVLNLHELEARDVCRVIRNGNSPYVFEICDSFWPYQKQPPSERFLGPETEFVPRVRGLFLAPACVQASFSAADEKLTHVGRVAKVKKQPASLRSASGPHHRNTQPGRTCRFHWRLHVRSLDHEYRPGILAHPVEEMKPRKVGQDVGNVRNNRPDLCVEVL